LILHGKDAVDYGLVDEVLDRPALTTVAPASDAPSPG
jgi:ATP-dependent protease ClpP protease subunit